VSSVAVRGRDELRGALDEAIGANEPRLVEVAVEPGMSLF
jgi:thiamine pyrophosphate-dependent acetolactate synthase large subunit-like protein